MIRPLWPAPLAVASGGRQTHLFSNHHPGDVRGSKCGLFLGETAKLRQVRLPRSLKIMNKEKVILPPNSIEVEGPIIFLAGPIRGAQDWQGEAIKIIHRINPQISIASPRREYLDGEFVYERQVDWETKYLRRSAKNGVILFWLSKEFEHDHGRAYAQTSRFELAEWKMRHEHDGAKLVIGIEDGFTGARYIRRRFSQDCPNVLILNSLEDTCKKAVELTIKSQSEEGQNTK